jgi:hypothetical protein
VRQKFRFPSCRFINLLILSSVKSPDRYAQSTCSYSSSFLIPVLLRVACRAGQLLKKPPRTCCEETSREKPQRGSNIDTITVEFGRGVSSSCLRVSQCTRSKRDAGSNSVVNKRVLCTSPPYGERTPDVAGRLLSGFYVLGCRENRELKKSFTISEYSIPVG